MALSGQLKTVMSNYYDLWIDWKVNSQDIASRTSNVTVTFKAQRNHPDANVYNNSNNSYYALWVGGSDNEHLVGQSSTNVDFRNDNLNTFCSYTADIPHNPDGTLSLYLRGNFEYTVSGTSLAKGVYAVSGYAEIDPIRGLVRIYNGTDWETYQAYIHNGTSWELYEPYIHNGTGWDACS